MNDLANTIIAAHGGLDRWRTYTTLSAHLLQGGALWPVKGQGGVLDDTTVTVGLKSEYASHAPFGRPGRKSSFTPGLVSIQTDDGAIIEQLAEPRRSFAGHTLETPWTELQLAYFAGCAMWTYLNMPFLLAAPRVESRRIDPWHEGSETWQRLRVRFPENVATHSSEQTLYVGSDGLLKRHDYDVEIAGNTPGAHYISEYREIHGIMIPTRRRIFPRQPDGTSLADPLVVSIDLDRIELR